MDIYCPKCGEPWSHDELHGVSGMTYPQASKAFRRIGCEVFDSQHSQDGDEDRAQSAAIAYDLFGDDLDGAAATFDDLFVVDE